MRSVNDAIEDRVSQGWIPNNLMPAADGNLAGDEQRGGRHVRYRVFVPVKWIPCRLAA
jgi:hypothetical protein